MRGPAYSSPIVAVPLANCPNTLGVSYSHPLSTAYEVIYGIWPNSPGDRGPRNGCIRC